MKQITIWVKKNGDNLQNGIVYITDEFGQVYMLQIVPSDYFYAPADGVERIATMEIKP